MPNLSEIWMGRAYADGNIGELLTKPAQVPELLLDQPYTFCLHGTYRSECPSPILNVSARHPCELMTYINHVSLGMSVKLWHYKIGTDLIDDHPDHLSLIIASLEVRLITGPKKCLWSRV